MFVGGWVDGCRISLALPQFLLLMKPFAYLLDVFDGQGWVEDIALLDDPGDAERVVDFSEALHCELE